MEKEKIFLTYQDITEACQHIYICMKDIPIDAVVGIGRGGLIPEVILGSKLDKMVYNIGISSYNNYEQGNLKCYQPCNNTFGQVLLVDDLSDNGKSMQYAYQNITADYIITATLYIKEGTTFIPDFYYKKYPKKSWLVFPNEV
jgi:hypoxanthine phosphoribosyltransferase